ncbi:MAG: histidinol dehydrogenase [Verrucomicrobiota bacterium]
MKIPTIQTISKTAILRESLSFNRFAEPQDAIQSKVSEILKAIKTQGDQALLAYTKKFDRATFTSKTIRLKSKAPKPDAETLDVLQGALKNIRAFSKRNIPKKWSQKNHDGAWVGEMHTPIQRVGIYVPGGTAPLVSTALMTVGIAQLAGVREIVVATPPPVNPFLHYALELCGATEIYQMGGAQAIGALAYGTESIKRVQKIFGPGNAFVVEAKRQVCGAVAIDLLPGPSEIAVVADETANPAFIASDLLAQGEHGHGSQALLISPSLDLLKGVQMELALQASQCTRKDFIMEVLSQGCHLLHVPSLELALTLADQYAPEHLSLIVKNPKRAIPKIKNAGAIFIGNYSPVAVGDYWAGPSHTLPTGGAGKSFPGLMIEQFYKRTSMVEYDARSIRKAAPSVAALAELEHLDAHAKSAMIRFH